MFQFTGLAFEPYVFRFKYLHLIFVSPKAGLLNIPRISPEVQLHLPNRCAAYMAQDLIHAVCINEELLE